MELPAPVVLVRSYTQHIQEAGERNEREVRNEQEPNPQTALSGTRRLGKANFWRQH
jgi:hypothetical protein